MDYWNIKGKNITIFKFIDSCIFKIATKKRGDEGLSINVPLKSNSFMWNTIYVNLYRLSHRMCYVVLLINRTYKISYDRLRHNGYINKKFKKSFKT